MAEETTEWTVKTLKEYEDVQISDLKSMLQERYVMQTKAVDSAFDAQQTAMTTAKTEQSTAMVTAFAAQKEAVNTAMAASEKAVNAAMAASEKAVDKAETAANKRFESVNEFRGQLADQATTFATRNDMDFRVAALTDKMSSGFDALRDAGDVREKAIATLRLDMTSRLDTNRGIDTGTADSRTNRRQDSSLIVSIGSLFLVLVSVVITIITVLSRTP